MRKIYCFRSFALDSAHVKFDVWNGPNKLTSSVFFFFDGSSDFIFVLICTGSSSHFPIHEVKRPVLQLCPNCSYQLNFRVVKAHFSRQLILSNRDMTQSNISFQIRSALSSPWRHPPLSVSTSRKVEKTGAANRSPSYNLLARVARSMVSANQR